MKIRTIGLTLAFCFLGAAACLAADPQMGTWKLNEAKSKITPGTTKPITVTLKSTSGNIKVTSHAVDGTGKAIHVYWSGKIDGKDYPVTGHADSDARSYTRVNDRTLVLSARKNGKVTATSRIVVSTDGKTRTATVSGTTAKGKNFKNVAVYDKE